MKDWRKTLIGAETTLRETIRVIDSGALRIALVVDADQRLLGTVSDGDIRRGILRGCSLEDSVQQVLNRTPTVAAQNEAKDQILALMRLKQVYQIPVIDGAGRVVGLEIVERILETPQYDNCVVLMAGGLGSRLKPLTDDTPKPLLKVGGKPILETILENFIHYGFTNFRISVNYKGELIEDYFGDGARWGAHIEYLREDKKLGTAGALGLLPERPSLPVLVMNGDVLTKVNFQQLLEFHREHRALATMCVREYDFQVPYGVVTVDNHRILNIEEKPVQRFFVNAGIYVLEPEALDLIPKDTFFDMPTLFEKVVSQQKETAVFPIREYWLDIGRMDDFQRAEGEFGKVFE
ncbi:nucleotidyltransferase family protein [Geomonas paludis]|uniref:Alcohol dehydrogenase n=1 Tax=Geomonas paludis TaxID=2740185 RepID=A0A6V8N432_9BACT|nr:nucleotidyltransferase family protein [Geomonas paludis]UPU36765.1 nucleotidyltransferase family protein [Geomonas paludis]GFO66059.1 alcohol dehydrogenase [Geomonas paludis]